MPRVTRCVSLLQELDPDLVIGYYVTSYGLMAALSWDGPLVIAPAGSDILRRTNFVGSQITRFVMSRSDLVLFWAQHMSSAVMSNCANGTRTMLLPRGIDTVDFSPDGPSRRPVAACSIVWTRSLKYVYDPETALRGFERFLRGGNHAHFTMLGDGPLGRPIDALANDLQIGEHVTRRGAISDPIEVAQYLRGADIYLASAVSDGASASLFEAMACGAFPVVTDIPANREWIAHGRNGLLFPPGDASALANALQIACDSADLRDAAAERNRQLVTERLDRSRNSSSMLEAFERLVQSRPRRPRRGLF